MFTNLLIASHICFLTCPFIDCKGDTNLPEGLRGLYKYVEQNSSAYKTMLIVNKDLFQKEARIEAILREINHAKPSMLFLVQNKTIEKDISNLKQWKGLGSPTTTFFMIVDDVQNNLNIATEILKLISILSKGQFRPKCLVLQFSDERTSLNLRQKKFLRYAWNNKFLDTSILESVGNASRVQYFNAFTNMYSTKKYTSGTALFPDKLANMNRYQLTASVVHYPPHINIEYNTSGYPINYSGKDILLLTTFAMKMNFVVHFEKSTTIFGIEKLLLNEVNIRLIRTMLQNAGKFSYLEHLVIGYGSFNALSPKVKIGVDSSELIFLYALAPITVFSAILWLLMYALKQYSNDWNLSFTVQVVLGLTVPHEPVNWKARIIFAYIVIVSFVYSSKIYAMLTSINLQSGSEIKISTLAELNKSGLALEANPAIISWMSEDVQNLSIVMKSQTRFLSPEDCVLHAITEKNVSCVMLKIQSNWFASRFKGGDGRALSATVDEPFVTSEEGFYLETGSPYVRRFRSLLLRLVACGIYEKWNKDVVPSISPTEKNKEQLADLAISRNELFPILVTELIVGFLISGIVFVVEIVVANIKRRGRV